MPQVHFIQLTEDTMCAHDNHELTHYPRPWFKAKPTLHAGTVLEVKEIFTNFYGQYYRCETSDGVYDIPIENAKDISAQFDIENLLKDPDFVEILKEKMFESIREGIENRKRNYLSINSPCGDGLYNLIKKGGKRDD